MTANLDFGENFAGFTVESFIPHSFVVEKYHVKDSYHQNCVLRIFNDWKTFDPKSQSGGVRYSIKGRADLWRTKYKQRHRPGRNSDGDPGINVSEECGDRFEYFQNRLAITEELSGLPGFPELMSAGSYNGHLYFATKFIEGQDLKKKIVDRGMQPDEKLKLMHRLVLPLEQMHRMNLLHNDVKPGNYIIGSNGTVVLMDFDLSLRGERKVFGGKSALWHESGKNGVGTYKFVAPEIVSIDLGMGFTEFSDVWSGLGVIPYCLLTGGLPFTGRDMDYLSRAIREEDPTRLDRLLSPNFPQRERVSDLVHWSLEKSWHKRPRAIDFRRELEGILTEEGIDWNETSDIKVA